MLRKVDKLNRIVIPSEILKELGISKEEQLNITIKNGNIVLNKVNKMATREEIESSIMRVKNLELNEFYKSGYIDALSWVLKGDE